MGDHAEAALRLAYKALRLAEWNGMNLDLDSPCCAVCTADKTFNEPHAADCELAAAITAIRELLPDVAEEGE